MTFRNRLKTFLEEQRVSPPEYLVSYRRLLDLNHRLGWEDTAQSIRLLMASTPTEVDRLAFLRAFSPERASGEMLATAAGVLQALAPRIPYQHHPLYDSCGTGGDRLGLFNLSTLAGLVIASAGVSVVKHGNRSITSQCGSADLLEGLGIPIHLSPDQAAVSLQKHRFAFLFAPDYHQATRNIQPLRKRLSGEGIPTLFNLLGPLSNPAQPSHQLVGVYHPRFTRPMAEALELLGTEKAWVVSGSAPCGSWIDEVSPCGPTRVSAIGAGGGLEDFEFDTSDFGLAPISLAELAGGDLNKNLSLTHEVLQGRPGAPLSAVALNAGIGLFLTGESATIPEGIERARDLLTSGCVAQKVQALVEFGRDLG